MRRSYYIVVVLIIIGFFLIQSFSVGESIQKDRSIFPAGVKKVIDNKCYRCHNANGKSQIAKAALIWDSLPNLQKGEMVARFDKIIRVLTKSIMPPESAVKRSPEMKLSPEESKLLLSWAEARADSLLK